MYVIDWNYLPTASLRLARDDDPHKLMLAQLAKGGPISKRSKRELIRDVV